MESKKIQPSYSDLHKSIEEIAEINSALIDERIQKRERTAGLKFVAGWFSIKWVGSKCTMTTELYFKDQKDQWKKEEIACERPLDIFTEESVKMLERQKEVTYEIRHP
ncbi:MAG: hypothetical protein SPL25_09125 [Succinivibrionaceae bacterium]|nr:hypothetical protein [Succinivibrionaceae bacterium]